MWRSSDIPKPLLVRPSKARALLGGCCTERLYQLLNDGVLESFRDGRARYITVRSIESYIASRLAEAGGTPASSPAAAPPRRRGRPPKDRSEPLYST
jgi:hypothetical protein